MESLRILMLCSVMGSGCTVTWHAFGDYEYYISPSNITFQQNFSGAQSACNAMNASLAKVNANDTQQFLIETINSTSGSLHTLYIGLKWNNSTNEYNWLDGATLNVSHWGPGQPSHNETCVAMAKYTSYLWDDVSCEDLTSYICSRYSARTTIHNSTSEMTPSATLAATTDKMEATTLSSGKTTATTTMATQLTTTSTIASPECCSCANDDLSLTTIILTAVISGVVFICIVESLVIWKMTRNGNVNKLAPPKVDYTERQVNFDVEPKQNTNVKQPNKPLPFEEDDSGYLKPHSTYPLQNLEDDQGYIEFSPS